MNKNRVISFALPFLLVPLFILSGSANAHGQAVSARLEGRVLDTSQAVIPGVVVVATNENTNIATETVTNDSGRFVFPNLTPGPYTLTAELPGFKRSEAKGILLQIGDSRTQNLVLQVGELTETVTVTGLGSAVDITSTKVGAVVQDRQAVDLPLQGRNAMMLIYLQAGTNPLDRLGSQQEVGVVDGLSPYTSSIKVEGILSSNPGYDYSPAHPSTPVPQEAVGEYRVSTSGEGSDVGKGSGAQVKVLVKSGTNEYHGSLFEFNRNTVYNANNFFNNRAGEPRPVLRRHQFGFAFGGPVIKDRTFFFVTAEWQRQNEDVIQNRDVYTKSLREGIFRFYKKGKNSTSLVDSNGNLVVPAEDIGSINLLTVDPTRLGLDTVFVQSKLFPQLPLPNNYDIGDGLNMAGYRFTSGRPYDYHMWLLKIDHQLTRSHQLAFSYSSGREHQPTAQLVNRKSAEDYEELRDGVSIRLVSAFSPKLTNEISLGANVRTALRPITNPDQETPEGNIQLSGLGSGNINISRAYQKNPAVNMGFQDNMTWVKGNHTVSFGGEFWRQTLNRKVSLAWPQINTSNSSNPATIPAQPGLNSTDLSRAQQLTNDLTGAIGTISQTFYLNDPKGYTPYIGNYQQLRKDEWSLFIQDIWKILPNFTLNYGLRYEQMPPLWIADGTYGYPIGGVDGALGIQGPAGQPTSWGFVENKGKDIYKTDNNNFAPSIGFNWDPFNDNKTAIMGSYRISYDRFMIVAGQFSSGNYGASTSVVLTPFITLRDPNLYGNILPVATPKVFAPLGFERLSTALTTDPHLATPYVQGWTFGIQRELVSKWTVSATYVGNHSVGTWRSPNFNQVEMRDNGFLEAFKIAQGNLAASGKLTTPNSLGALQPLFALIPSSQHTIINQGQAASLADYLDTTTYKTGKRGGLIEQAGLPVTFFRFNPQVSNLYIVGNRTHSTWNAMKLSINRRMQGGVYLQANYTFSKALTDAVPGQGFGDAYRDNANYKLDKALSELDSTHVVLMNGIWELPIGRGRRFLSDASGWANGFLGGWQLNGIYSFTTGRPLSFSTSRYTISQSQASTANYSGSWKNFSKVTKGNVITFLDAEQKAAFSNPTAGDPGGLPNYQFHGPGFSTVDLSIFKKFDLNMIREGTQLQFRAELYNAFNTTCFSSATSNINSGSFGNLSAARPARVGQFALKITF